MRLPIPRKSLVTVLLPSLALVLALKYVVHANGWEALELNTLFTAIVSANVFLLGFLLAGVLSDFKEAEKLPSELAGSLDSIIDDAIILHREKGVPAAKECLDYAVRFIAEIGLWLNKERRTDEILAAIRGFGGFFTAFEPHTQANYIVRLKQEQASLRRTVSRIDTIRDTSFVRSGYLIAEINSGLLIVGLVFIDMGPLQNALFFTLIITFLFLYMIALIKDLDNPFGFYENTTFENVPMSPLESVRERLAGELREDSKSGSGGR